ncbi:MAG: AarF/UbiB family protein [Solirubrobacteraceae bacterium]
MSNGEPFTRADALLQVLLRVVRSMPSGPIVFARLARAIDPAWIPRPWGEEIAAHLQSSRVLSAQPLTAGTIERVLRQAWGTRPTDELDELDLQPVAVTPTSQVHRGVLDGAPVAVKVLRPGLAAAMRRDLGLLDALLAPIGAAFPALDPRAIVHEFRARLLEELDLESEASAQRRFHRALRGHPWLTVPAPFMRLTHEQVLVSEWVEGVSLWDAPDPDGAAARLLLFTLGAASAGILHVDPDPDDVRVLPDGRLAILDFGAWCEVHGDRVRLARAALETFHARELEAFAGAVQRLGWLPSSHGGAALELVDRVLGALGRPGPVRLDADAVLGIRDRALDRHEAATGLMLAVAMPAEDLWPACAVAQLFAVIARVGATGDWVELTRAAMRDGWNASLGGSGPGPADPKAHVPWRRR